MHAGAYTLYGRSVIARWIGETGVSPLYLEYGTGTTAATENDTELETPVERALATTIRRTGVQLELRKTWTNDTEDVITPSEVGIWTAASGGTLIYRGVIALACRRAWDEGETWELIMYLPIVSGSF